MAFFFTWTLADSWTEVLQKGNNMHRAAECSLSSQLHRVLASYPSASNPSDLMRVYGKEEPCLLGGADLLAQQPTSSLRAALQQCHGVVLAITSVGSLSLCNEIQGWAGHEDTQTLTPGQPQDLAFLQLHALQFLTPSTPSVVWVWEKTLCRSLQLSLWWACTQFFMALGTEGHTEVQKHLPLCQGSQYWGQLTSSLQMQAYYLVKKS